MIARAVMAAVIIAALSGCARKERERPLFALGQCDRIALIDEATGAAVVGAEDLDIDRKTGRLFVSAYDRREAEKAAANGARSVPQGGLYAVDIGALRGGEATLKVRSLVDPATIDGGLRPHGIAFDPDSGALAFVNRGYASDGDGWRREVGVVILDPAAPASLSAAPAECSANDLTFNNGKLLTTLDRGGCGWRAAVEDVFGTRGGRLIDATGAALLEKVGFANGAVTMSSGLVVVAATRERSLRFVGGAPPIKLNGAPDNLTMSEDGRIVAAVHPSLLAIGLQRQYGIGRSASRVIEINPGERSQRLLFDDPNADLIAAATAAILTDGLLVIGSVIDAGLVVCHGETTPQ